MKDWNRFTEQFGIDLPIIQAPMAGSTDSALAVAVCRAGALGSLPCALMDVDTARAQIAAIRDATPAPFNVNFFCHTPPEVTPDQLAVWRETLAPYFGELGLDLPEGVSKPARQPFDEVMCKLMEEARPAVVSFHFGLPEANLVERVRATGAKILASATTVQEACWLEHHGVDAVIAQGVEAGGHRGMFLTDNVNTQTATFSLLPQVVDAISLPVIAAGGIADGRGIRAALEFGASAVQIGTAYLLTREAITSKFHRQALLEADEGQTALTNLFSGRPARGITNRTMRDLGPMSDRVVPFPLAGNEMGLLKAAAEAEGRNDFSSLWSGQAGAMSRAYNDRPATGLTLDLAREAGLLG